LINKISILLNLIISTLLIIFYFIFNKEKTEFIQFYEYVFYFLLVFFTLIGFYSFFSYSRVVITSKFINKKQIDKIKNTINNEKFNKYIKLIEDENKNNPEEIIVDVDNIKLSVRNPIDLALIRNIFIKKVYSYFFTNPTVVMDIGANIGYSAIWFAKEKLVDRVYAYEPVLPTFNQAKRSLELNPEIIEKIILNNYGLSDENDNLKILYSKEHHTISSIIFPVINLMEKDNLNSNLVNVELKDIKNEIKEVINYKRNKNLQLLLKIDCEGCEYKILRSFTGEIWNELDVILMEIHGSNYNEIIGLLFKNNFKVFYINHTDHQVFDHLCDLYAVKL